MCQDERVKASLRIDLRDVLLDGTPYRIAIPAEWNGTLLEGTLEDSIPRLKDEVEGDLFVDQRFHDDQTTPPAFDRLTFLGWRWGVAASGVIVAWRRLSDRSVAGEPKRPCEL